MISDFILKNNNLTIFQNFENNENNKTKFSQFLKRQKMFQEKLDSDKNKMIRNINNELFSNIQGSPHIDEKSKKIINDKKRKEKLNKGNKINIMQPLINSEKYHTNRNSKNNIKTFVNTDIKDNKQKKYTFEKRKGNNKLEININNKENNKISTQSNANNQIESQSKENIRDNSKINIINLINNIITKISMGNMDIKQDIDNLQKSILDIVDKNDKMKEKIDKMEMNISKQHQDIVKLTEDNQKQNQDIVKQNQDIVKLTEDNQKQNQDIEELKERVEFLEGECDDLKEMLSKIQFRGLSKNFLRCFHTYLEEDDWKIIERNKKLKGEVISKKIAKLYPNADKKKLQIIQNLVKKASNLLNKGNSLAHSVTLSRYQKEIKDYKEKNKLDKITSPALFCYVVSLEISQGFDEPFENSLSFLSGYFQKNLVSAKSSDLLESYFSN